MFIDNYVSWTDSSNNFTNKLFQESFHIILLHRYLINDYIIEVFFFWHGGTTSSIYLKNAGTNQSETYDDYWRYSKCREKEKSIWTHLLPACLQVVVDYWTRDWHPLRLAYGPRTPHWASLLAGLPSSFSCIYCAYFGTIF